MRKAKMNTSKTISSKTYMLLGSAADVDIIGQTTREITAVFSRIVKKSAKVDLADNEDKTKLMVSMSRASTRLPQYLYSL